MDDLNQSTLPKATAEKLQLYRQTFTADSEVPFWDIVVLTAGNEDQKKSFQEQIDLRLKHGEIPTSVKYLVFSDPPGAKIGNGGATMYVLQEMKCLLGWEELQTAKVLLLHAGGYSQRLAHVSATGKVFMALPCGDSSGKPSAYQMLDLLLIMYADLPRRMDPGVFLASCDVFFLYNGAGEWSMKGPGVVAIAHPSNIDFCTNHGVFVLKDMGQVWERYTQDRSKPASMADVSRFLHKSSQEVVMEAGAVIPGPEQRIYVDVAYWFDFITVKKMTQFYAENAPLGCEVDAYGDFLQALGPDSTPDYCEQTSHVTTATDGLVDIRRKVYQLLKDTPFRAVVFNQAQFNHVGTTKECLHHYCYNQTLIEACQFQPETAVSNLSVSNEWAGPPEKRAKVDDQFQHSTIICSRLNNRESIHIGPGTIVEYSSIGEGARIGARCIVSCLDLPPGSTVPDCSFLHTLPVTLDNKICYVTFVFDVVDSMKATKDPPLDLSFCSLTLREAVQKLFPDRPQHKVWPKETDKCTLWSARLFPALPSQQLSSQFAIDTLNCLKDTSSQPPSLGDEVQLLSVRDMVTVKSLKTLLSYCNELRQIQ